MSPFPFVAIAASAVSLLAPYLKKKAEQLAGKVVKAVTTAAWKKSKELHEAIDAKFAGKEAAKKALVDLAKNPEDLGSQEAVRVQLTELMQDDETFAKQIVDLLKQAAEAGADQVFNTQIRGDVNKFVQMRDVYGDVHF